MTDSEASPTDLEVDGTITDRETHAALTVLRKIAGDYNWYITYGELKSEVTDLIKRESRQPPRYWADRILGRVVALCETNGYLQLTSLVIRGSDGGVGDGFNAVLTRAGRDRTANPNLLEMVAAKERLNFYRVYCSGLPEDAEPALTQIHGDVLARRTKSELREHPACASCGIRLPAIGWCDDCD